MTTTTLRRMGLGRRSAMTVLLGMLVLAGNAGRPPAAARSLTQAPIVSWSEPQVVWETAGYTTTPILLTDAWGQVHLFFLSTNENDKQGTLYHADVDNPDAEPIDVLTDVNEYRVTADPYGRIHVAALGSGNTLVYASVDATEAGRAAAWTPGERIGTAAPGIDISADANGGLHLCFPFEHSAAHQRSDDGGRSWSDPVNAADMVDASGVATFVRCVGDRSGAVHVTWAEAHPPTFYPPDGVYYTLSTDGGKTWAPSETIAGQHFTMPTLFADPFGLVHLLWQGDVAAGGRYYRQRAAGADGRWGPTETVAPDKQGGMSGDAFLASDSRGTLHVGMNVDGIFWANRSTAWSTPLEVSASLRDVPNPSGSIERATLAIANGNEIYVAFAFDYKRIYVLSGQSNAPEAVRTPQSDPFLATAAAPDAAGSLTARPQAQAGTQAAATATDPADGLDMEALSNDGSGIRRNLAAVLGTLPALIVVAWAVWSRRRGRRRRGFSSASSPGAGRSGP